MQRIVQLLFAVTVASLALAASTPKIHGTTSTSTKNDKTVLILGGGVSGIIAARTLVEKNITDFLIVEARDELGGRMRSMDARTIELGANWIQGTQEGDGPANPILTLAREHGVKTEESDFYGSVGTYDETGKVDYLGCGRVPTKQVDATCRTGYSLIGVKPKTPAEMVTEYYVTSWIASSWANNFTFDPDQGGFADDNLLSIDQRGFKHLIQAEAETFLKPEQVLLNATVRTIGHSGDGVIVTLANGTRISADYAISTFSLGVLQNDDVVFEPVLPIMTMATYTKIFLQFEEKFWFDTQFALYADKERGRYPVWQAFFFPRWFSDPLYRGSYSNWPASFVSPHHTNLRANVGKRLWFSGEAMSQRRFLHGAYFEGMDTGGRVANCVLSGGHCEGLPHVESIPNSSPYII
ncbi:hypothetical protein B0H14DRAFT_2750094 [Mycena olivaceomarginata]|nr:hypothetical protein B0H14DRAFT_2750094 [Mycena olivaceomarginata]